MDDDKFVDSLRIGGSLKGQSQTNIQVSGAGAGYDMISAREDMTENMKKLQIG